MVGRPKGPRVIDCVFRLVLIGSAAAVLVRPAVALAPCAHPDWTLFPVPPRIEGAVRFWTDIFGRYDQDQWVVHDGEQMDLVWSVVEGEIPGTRAAKRHVSREVERVRKTLVKLATRGGSPYGLTEGETAILEVARSLGGPAEWRKAASRIHVQTGMRGRFIEGVRRSGLYGDRIRETLLANGVPVEIAALPHVESSYNHAARSKVGAAGIWQFMPATGRLYLAVDVDLDERRDPVRATEAAARYLRESYAEFGNWPLAITSYNFGQHGIRKAIAESGSRDLGVLVESYNGRRFGFAVKNFYAEFVAVLRVLEHCDEYLPGVEPYPAVEAREVPTRHYIGVKDVLASFDLDADRFRDLNPALLSLVMSGDRRIPAGYRMRLPADVAPDPDAAYSMIPASALHAKQVPLQTYTVRRGDALSTIARRFGTTARELSRINGLSGTLIRPGQVLRLPPRG